MTTTCAAGYYFSGDGAYRTSGGYYQITGRVDDVINISGHRLGTAEIEDALVSGWALPPAQHPRWLGGVGELTGWGLTCFMLCLALLAQADHPAVPETAVIGYPHDIKGEGEVCVWEGGFLSLRAGPRPPGEPLSQWEVLGENPEQCLHWVPQLCCPVSSPFRSR